MCLSADWAGMLILPNYCLHSFVWCVWVCTFRPCISSLPWMCFLVGLGLCASRVGFFLGLQGSSFLFLLFLGFGVVVASSLACSGGLGACSVACSFLASPPSLPLGCLLVLSGPVSLAGPSLRISGCICDGPVVIPLAWRVVAIGSCLPSASWQQRLRPCVGLCPLHHAVGVVHVPLAAALRYSPSGDPESPLNTAKAVRAHLGLCCFLLPASAAFPGVRSVLFAGLRLEWNLGVPLPRWTSPPSHRHDCHH